jgi:hypothetical protein
VKVRWATIQKKEYVGLIFCCDPLKELILGDKRDRHYRSPVWVDRTDMTIMSLAGAFTLCPFCGEKIEAVEVDEVDGVDK